MGQPESSQTAPAVKTGEIMILRIKDVKPLPDFRLSVLFDDGRKVIYDVADDMRDITDYRVLREIPGLFQNVQLDKSRTCVFWNDDVDIASDIIYEYGITEVAGWN